MMQVGSCECTNNDLELFSLPPTLTSIEKSQHIEYLPLGSLTDDTPIEFFVSNCGDEYIDLAKTYLYLELKVTKADGTDLEENAKVGPVNNLLHTLFSQIDLSLNGQLVTSANNTYPYRAYIETLLSYGEEAKKSQLQAGLWYADEPGKFEKVDPTAADTNSGFKTRAKFIAKSRQLDLFGRLHLDLCHQNRYLLNGVDMKIRLNRTKNTFFLMSDLGTEVTKITKAILLVQHVKPNPAVLTAHAKALNTTNARYHIRRVEVKTFSVNTGTQTITRDNVFLGQVPRRVIVFMTENAAQVGAKNKNPFNLKHNDLNFISIEANSRTYPAQPLTPAFGTKNNYIQSYMTMFSETGKIHDDNGNDITRESYRKGYTLWVFDLSPDREDGNHVNLVKEGNLRLDLKFAEALTETMSVFVYAEFDNVIEIDRARNIIKDFQ
ncbi:uncharacterized protein F54H12.2-like [Lineus longissimus]|uniref:uncharacterized protein F54H12.2-like n=1 Tax=Lineus longissimus TaxID=88925 RepID=UPI00315CAF3E